MVEPHSVTSGTVLEGEHYGATAKRSKVVCGAVALSLSVLLIQACASGDVAAVANLVSEQNADPFFKEESGSTPLGVACEAGHIQVAKYLIETGGVSPGFRGKDGSTPLHVAARGGHLDVVRYLVEDQQVNPLCKDNNGLKPIDCAENGHVRSFLSRYNSREAQAYVSSPGINTSHHQTLSRPSTETDDLDVQVDIYR